MDKTLFPAPYFILENCSPNAGQVLRDVFGEHFDIVEEPIIGQSTLLQLHDRKTGDHKLGFVLNR